VLRQVHLWTSLVLCLPPVVLGVTGSILVFRDELGSLFEPPPRLIVETGKPHAVTEIIAAVQARIDKEFTPVLYEGPNAPEQPATLRFVALGGAAKGPRIIDVLVDPVTLDFVTWHYTVPGFLRVIIRLHGNLLMGRAGRVYVGWLGLTTQLATIATARAVCLRRRFPAIGKSRDGRGVIMRQSGLGGGVGRPVRTIP
jgi:uncharacterized iron-regulated membrane protein